MPANKSALNGFLVKLDNLAFSNTPFTESRVAELNTVLAGVAALMEDPDFEVNRDLFDGVSNELRRAFVAQFFTWLSTTLMRSAVDPEYRKALLGRCDQAEMNLGARRAAKRGGN